MTGAEGEERLESRELRHVSMSFFITVCFFSSKWSFTTTIPVCMEATGTQALRVATCESLANGPSWSVTSKKLATGC
jgi:hypothetical protein